MNPTKMNGTDKFTPRLSQMIAGWRKSDPGTKKKLPVEVDVPEQMAQMGRVACAIDVVKAVGDLALIAFYFLLRVGEYTVKGRAVATSAADVSDKQTEQFRVRDARFFAPAREGTQVQIPPHASDEAIMNARGATLRLGNQKNGWKNVCIHQEANGCDCFCPVRALGRRVCYIRKHTADRDTLLSAYWVDGARYDVTDGNMREGIKAAAETLCYPETRGIEIDDVDTHSLRGGGANALHMAGYTDRQIMKMGRWKTKTFLEYIREELGCFSSGMSRAMKRVFKYVNASGDRWSDVTSFHRSPDTLTYLKTRFIARDIPDEKHPSSSRMYSRKVFVFQRPIFMIWRSV